MPKVERIVGHHVLYDRSTDPLGTLTCQQGATPTALCAVVEGVSSRRECDPSAFAAGHLVTVCSSS